MIFNEPDNPEGKEYSILSVLFSAFASIDECRVSLIKNVNKGTGSGRVVVWFSAETNDRIAVCEYVSSIALMF